LDFPQCASQRIAFVEVVCAYVKRIVLKNVQLIENMRMINHIEFLLTRIVRLAFVMN